jgi:hypothetical protein
VAQPLQPAPPLSHALEERGRGHELVPAAGPDGVAVGVCDGPADDRLGVGLGIDRVAQITVLSL